MRCTLEGQFYFNMQLLPEHKEYLFAFSNSRRVQRDVRNIVLDDPIRYGVGLPKGEEGAYCCSREVASIVSFTVPPRGQPSLWCDWLPNENGTALIWDARVDFESGGDTYEEWLVYIRDHFLIPWGYVIDGAVRWGYGDQIGVLYCTENVIQNVRGHRIILPVPRREGYGEDKLLPFVAYSPDIYTVMFAVFDALRYQEARLDAYREEIDGVNAQEFYAITKRYVRLEGEIQ